MLKMLKKILFYFFIRTYGSSHVFLTCTTKTGHKSSEIMILPLLLKSSMHLTCPIGSVHFGQNFYDQQWIWIWTLNSNRRCVRTFASFSVLRAHSDRLYRMLSISGLVERIQRRASEQCCLRWKTAASQLDHAWTQKNTRRSYRVLQTQPRPHSSQLVSTT